ncbi:MAG TPA: AMP-binding protein [Polyangiaceae bacterium]|nr:AMP-binding protein [Polyangiaceae bacterium]
MRDSKETWLALVRKHRQPFDKPEDARYWAPVYECMPRDQLLRLQGERIAAAYRYLWDCSAFYRNKFSSAGLDRESVNSVADLGRVPLTHREEWMADQHGSPPWGTFSPLSQEDWLANGWMMFATSGTMAPVPRAFRHTNFDRELWTWHGARALYAMGVRRGDIAINCFGYGTSVAFWGLHYALGHMGVPVIPGGGANTERRVTLIQTFKPTLLLCTPSYACYLARVMQDMGEDPAASSIKRIVAAGEPGACVPATKARIEALWGAQLHDDFGCTEVAMSPLGYTCEYQVGRQDGVDTHVMEDSYCVEIVNPQTWTPVEDGERGVMVVSNLFSEAQPVLRYVMGDWATLTREKCRCGRTHARVVGGLQGRSDQLIKVRGLMFYPAGIEDAFRCQDELGDDFKVEIYRQNDMDVVRATVEPRSEIPKGNYDEFAAQVARRLKGKLGIEVEVVVVPFGTLPRTEFKAKRFFDLR